MSKITEIGNFVRSHLVGAQLGSDAEEPQKDGSEAIQPSAKTGKVRSRRSVGVSEQPALQSQTGARSIGDGSHAQKIADANIGRKTSKQQVVVGLLLRDDGATIDELMDATAWQAHSVRGFLSSTVRRKLKLNLISDVVGNGVRRYRVGAAEDNDAVTDADRPLEASSPSEHPVTEVASSGQVA